MTGYAKTHVPTLAEVDLAVIGSGTAGCCAALAAASNGAGRVLLIERYGFAGGTSTQMLTTFYGFFTPGANPRKVVGGWPDRVVDRLHAEGAIYLRPNTYGAGTGITYNPEILKWVWDDLLARAGVEVWLHATLLDVETGADGMLTGAILATKGGLARIGARRFIDASGDADLCRLAGLECERAGEKAPGQTLTTTFRFSNVDWESYRQAGGKDLLQRLMAEAVESGRHPLPRRSGSIHAMVQTGCASTVASRVQSVDPADFRALSEAEREGRRQAMEYWRFFRSVVPGFAQCDLIGLSHSIGVRESHRVQGEYRLTEEDCLGSIHFADTVALCGAPIEDHREARTGESETDWKYIPNGGTYGIPYRTLVPRGRDDCWVAGRCFSATHEAHASCRSMAQTMAMGQAAGTAAAISLRAGTGARQVPVENLRDLLRRQGAILEDRQHPAHTGPAEWALNQRFQT